MARLASRGEITEFDLYDAPAPDAADGPHPAQPNWFTSAHERSR